MYEITLRTTFGKVEREEEERGGGGVIGLDPANLRGDSYDITSNNPSYMPDKAIRPLLQIYREELETIAIIIFRKFEQNLPPSY